MYEPLILVERCSERQTSRAAEPELEHVEGRHYHRECRLAAMSNGRER